MERRTEAIVLRPVIMLYQRHAIVLFETIFSYQLCCVPVLFVCVPIPLSDGVYRLVAFRCTAFNLSELCFILQKIKYLSIYLSTYEVRMITV